MATEAISGEALDDLARRIIDEYTEQLTALVRRRLSPQILRRIGISDILQAAFRSFISEVTHGRQIDSIERLLVAITLRKARNAAKYHTSVKRDVALDVPLDVSEQSGGNFRRQAGRPGMRAGEQPTEAHVESTAGADNGRLPENGELLDLMRLGATDEQAEVVIDLIQSLDAQHRRVVLLRLGGCSNQEIAQEIGRVPYTVSRRLTYVRRKWQQLLEADE